MTEGSVQLRTLVPISHYCFETRTQRILGLPGLSKLHTY